MAPSNFVHVVFELKFPLDLFEVSINKYCIKNVHILGYIAVVVRYFSMKGKLLKKLNENFVLVAIAQKKE